MDELLQLDLSNAPQIPSQAVSQPAPGTHTQPSVLEEMPAKEGDSAWASPFAAWDNLVGVSPTESVRTHAKSQPAHVACRP